MRSERRDVRCCNRCERCGNRHARHFNGNYGPEHNTVDDCRFPQPLHGTILDPDKSRKCAARRAARAAAGRIRVTRSIGILGRGHLGRPRRRGTLASGSQSSGLSPITAPSSNTPAWRIL
jgi:hypothetical protein